MREKKMSKKKYYLVNDNCEIIKCYKLNEIFVTCTDWNYNLKYTIHVPFYCRVKGKKFTDIKKAKDFAIRKIKRITKTKLKYLEVKENATIERIKRVRK